MGILDGLFGGGGSDPYDIYGDLFTDKQKAAMRDQQQGQGLLRMAAALGQAAMPSRLPVPIGAVLGQAAGALGTGQDAAMEQMLKAAQTAEVVRQSKQTRDFQLKFLPFYEQIIQKELLKGGAGVAPSVPPVPGGPPAAPGPGGGPAAAAPAEAPTTVDMPYPAAGGLTGYGMPTPPDNTRWGMPRRASLEGPLAAPDSGGGGPPDELVRQGQGLIPRLAAGYGGDASGMLPFGQDDSGTPTVRLASAALAPFAIGNAVMGGPSSVGGVSDALSQRIVDMAAKMPPEIRNQFAIISGYRDAARQAQVNPGAPNSRHGAGTGPPGTGMAVDLRSDPAVLDWITRNPQYGVGFPLAADPAERNHLEMLTAEGGRIGGSARRGGRFGGMGPDAGVGGGGQESSLPALAALSSLLGLSGGASGLPDLSALLRLTGGGGGSSGGAAAPGRAGSDVLDSVIAPLESGNRNVMQGVVDPSVSTAGGFYQITNSTWRDTAPKAGVDLGKYPTAISAPRDVQKQVAQQLLDTRGVQPWADFNPAVAAATGYRRGGRFAGMGPDAGGGGGDLSSLVQLMAGPGGLSMPPSQMSGGGGPAPDAASAGEDREVTPTPPAFQQGLSPEVYRQRYGQAYPPGALERGVPGSGGGAAPAPPPAAAPAAAPAPAMPLATPPGAGAALATPPAAGVALATPAGAGLVPGLGVTPQALAALNAMAEMAKLGTPFKSLLETYYKSPEYLSQAATATKGAELRQEALLRPEIEARIAWAKINPNLSEYERKAQVDRYTKQLEQLGAAEFSTQEAQIYGPDGKTVVTTKMTQRQLTQKAAEAAARAAAGDTTPRPGDIASTPYVGELDKPVNVPGIGMVIPSQVLAAQRAAAAGAATPAPGAAAAPAPGAAAAPGAQPGVLVPTIGEAPKMALDKNLAATADKLKTYHEEHQSAAEQVANATAINDLMGRVRMGWSANTRQEGARILAGIGVPQESIQQFLGTDPSAGDALNKLFLQFSAGAVRVMGAREPGSVISLFAKAYPNLETMPHAAELMNNALMMQAQWKKDRANAAEQHATEQERGMGQFGQNYTGMRGFEEKFGQTNDPNLYWKAAAAMSNEPEIAWKGASDADKQRIYNMIPAGRTYRAGDGKLYRKPGP